MSDCKWVLTLMALLFTLPSFAGDEDFLAHVDKVEGNTLGVTSEGAREWGGCDYFYLTIDEYDYFKWNVVARLFSYRRPNEVNNRAVLDDLNKLKERDIRFVLWSRPRVDSKCNYYIDGVNVYEEGGITYLYMFYTLTSE